MPNRFQDPDYDRLDEDTRRSIDDFVLKGRHPGTFLYSVMSNDLRQAIDYGDGYSVGALRGIVKWLHCRCPGSCWGSAPKVEDWKAHKGLEGYQKHTGRVSPFRPYDELLGEEMWPAEPVKPPAPDDDTRFLLEVLGSYKDMSLAPAVAMDFEKAVTIVETRGLGARP
jgi:hypothetical protein